MPISPVQSATLKIAITGDAALATFVTARNCPAIADYYAVVTATLINSLMLPKADFLLGVMAGIAALNGATSLLQNKWDRFLRIVGAVENIRVTQPAVQSLLGQLVTDGLMTQPQIDAFTKRPATRAENLLGAGVVISITDVAEAIYNPDGSLKL